MAAILPVVPAKPPSPFAEGLRMYMRNPAAVVGLVMLVVIVLLAAVAVVCVAELNHRLLEARSTFASRRPARLRPARRALQELAGAAEDLGAVARAGPDRERGGVHHRSGCHGQRGSRFRALTSRPANFATKPRPSGGAFLLRPLL